MENELVYIATPYMPTGEDDEAIKFKRFRNVTQFAAELMARGLHVYSPITHCHPMAMSAKLPGDWAFWQSMDRKYLGACTAMIVYQQDGWDKSTGVGEEMAIHASQTKPILFIPVGMDPDEVIEMFKQLIPVSRAQQVKREKIAQVRADISRR